MHWGRRYCDLSQIHTDDRTTNQGWRPVLFLSARDNPRTPSGNGRCNSRAFGASAASQRPTSSGVVRMTGMAFGWIDATTALGAVVRKPNSSCSPSTGALLGPRTPRQGVHRPAKAKSGLSSLRANHMGVLRGFGGGLRSSMLAAIKPRSRRPCVSSDIPHSQSGEAEQHHGPGRRLGDGGIY